MQKANIQLSKLSSSLVILAVLAMGITAHCDEEQRTPYLNPYRLGILCIQANGDSFEAYPWKAGGRRRADSEADSGATHVRPRQPDRKDNATHTFRLFLFEHLSSEILSKGRFLRSWSPDSCGIGE